MRHTMNMLQLKSRREAARFMLIAAIERAGERLGALALYADADEIRAIHKAIDQALDLATGREPDASR